MRTLSAGSFACSLGDEAEDNLLHSELAWFGFTPLDEKTAEALIEKG